MGKARLAFLFVGVLSLVAGASLLLTAGTARADVPVPPGCDFSLADPGDISGEQRLFCVPPGGAWNGLLVVYAHGYVSPHAPLRLPLGELTFEVDGTEVFLPLLLVEHGFAFATTSYSKNGYAVEEAGGDLAGLVEAFADEYAAPAKVFLVGASEGGLITVMLLERTEIFDGGLSLCGPVGGMPYQIDYLGDFRVVFDYFFPTVFPAWGVVDVPCGTDWKSYEPQVQHVIGADLVDGGDRTRQLFRVTRAAADPASPLTFVNTALQVLEYNIEGTCDLLETAGGNPYWNRFRWYRGSDNDWKLNFGTGGVERVRTDWPARSYLRAFYRPTGMLELPLVTLHTTGDEAVPFRHQLLYLSRVLARGRGGNLTVIPVDRYGHCNFALEEVLGSFALLVWKVTGSPPPGMWEFLGSLQGPVP